MNLSSTIMESRIKFPVTTNRIFMKETAINPTWHGKGEFTPMSIPPNNHIQWMRVEECVGTRQPSYFDSGDEPINIPGRRSCEEHRLKGPGKSGMEFGETAVACTNGDRHPAVVSISLLHALCMPPRVLTCRQRMLVYARKSEFSFPSIQSQAIRLRSG